MTYKSNKPAFTLVELLVTIAIIAILASMSLVALSSSRGQAKIFRTRSTIMKIDTAIGEIYERYEYERTIGDEELAGNAANDMTPLGYVKKTGISAPEYNRRLNQMKLMAMRDLIRKEMPMNWIEVSDTNPNPNIENMKIGNVYGSNVPVSRYYKIAHTNSGNDENASAELLYLIIANLNPEALSNFATGEIGDTDNDGLPEFIDGWGNPIRFIRWAPGLYDSEIQPVIYNLDGTLKSIDEIKELREKNTDPLDTTDTGTNKKVVKPFTLDKDNIPEITDTQTYRIGAGFARGWFLYPLIVSGGPDGDHGLYGLEGVTTSSFECANPFIIKDMNGSKPLLFGAPLPARSNAYKDNIHNHQR